LALLRQLAALSLAHDAYVYINWVPTEVNPADGPSRRYEFDSTLGFPGEGPPSFLFEAASTPATRARYAHAVSVFTAYLGHNGLVSDSPEDLDVAFADWCHALYAEHGGTHRSVANNALAGIHLFLPRLKGAMVYASLALKGWERSVPSQPYPPITWEMAVAIGVRIAGTSSWSSGVGIVLAFDCYLRKCELLRLTVGDILLPGSSRAGSVFADRCALRIGVAKTGREQFVEVLRPEVIVLLTRVVSQAVATGASTSTLLFPSSPSALLRDVKEAATTLGLDPRVVVHSCRHGGATGDFLAGTPITDIQHRGRWASLKSAQHYIQMGRALLMASTAATPPASLALADAVAADVLASFTLAQEHYVGVG
jgi:integrase